LRCGAKHTLLRNEFVEVKQEAKKSSNIIPEILVIMGGADTAQLNLPILQTLAHCRPLVAHVVTTRANRHLSRLEAYANQNPWIRLHVESNRLAALMARVDVAIVTPSVTMNEIWYMELPFIVIQTAQNQRYMSDYLRQLGEPVFTTFDPNTMKKTLETYLDPDVPSLIHFGRLDEARLLQILKWRNAPQVRQWMHQKDPISANDHLAYVQSLHQRFDRLYFLARHRGDDIGVVDLTAIDRKERSAKIGLYAVPSKKGVGKLLMRGILQKSKMLGLDKLIAEVYATNERAIALYRRFGFEIHGKKWIDRKKLLIMECRV
jgi:UDP-4-amino-4,6-dideoxy-N-acetyl-beta-L-altrosamine N-acetyltransferase